MTDASDDAMQHHDPLYYLRQAIRRADGAEKEALEDVHNRIVENRAETTPADQ